MLSRQLNKGGKMKDFFSSPLVVGILIIAAVWVIAAKIVFIAWYLRKKTKKPDPGAVDAPTVVPEEITAPLKDLADKIGITVTDLHPAGSAKIDDKKYDVVSDGEYIKKDSPVRVVKVEGRVITVKRMEDGW